MPLGMLNGCASFQGVLKNWTVVYIANLIGSIFLAWMIYNAAYAARFDDPVKKTVLQSGAMALLHFDKSLLLLVVLAAFGLLTAFCPPLILLASISRLWSRTSRRHLACALAWHSPRAWS